jgi:hypothetical protein
MMKRYFSDASTKGSLRNEFTVSGAGFASGLVAQKKRNRRHSQSYVEDYATDGRAKDDGKGVNRNGGLFLSEAYKRRRT